MNKKTPDYQLKAIKKWEKNNPEYSKYTNSRSQARRYAREYAKRVEDIEELKEIFKKENPNYTRKTENDD